MKAEEGTKNKGRKMERREERKIGRAGEEEEEK